MIYHSPYYFTYAPDEIFQSIEDRFFSMALRCAEQAMGSTHPNPAVGAVIVKDGVVLATGFTHPPGGFHAEADVLTKLQGNAPGATLYVTLEPCSIFGRTPPCVDAIIKAKVARVVFGCFDPNPKVHTHGVAALRAAGITCQQIGNETLQQRAQALVEPFKKYISRSMPYVVMKVALTRDGKIASAGQRHKITHASSDAVIHTLRRATDAILVGGNTVHVDDPQLTSRLAHDSTTPQSLRIVLGGNLQFDPNRRVFDARVAPTVVYHAARADHETQASIAARGAECVALDDAHNLLEVLGDVAKRAITSVLVEPGQKLFDSFMASGLSDEVWLVQSPHVLGHGLSLSDEGLNTLEKRYTLACCQTLEVDTLRVYRNLPE